MFEYLFFDLDGTLTDPALGITNSFVYALKSFGLEIPSYETLRINQQFNNNNLNNNKINEYRNDILKKYNTDHLFNQGSDSDYNNERSHKKIFPLNSNMGDILAHDNVPKGYDVYSSKPN